MATVNINVPGIKDAMTQVHTCLEDSFVQIKKMNEALDTVERVHQSTNAQTIQQDVVKIEGDLRAAFTEMASAHHDVYEKGNALLKLAGEAPIAEPDVPNLGPERSPGGHSGDHVVYDPQALEHYNEAHANVAQAGSLVNEINDLFQNKIPVAFESQAAASIVAHHQVIHSKFEEAHNDIMKLLGDTAPGEVNDLFALDRQLSG